MNQAGQYTYFMDFLYLSVCRVDFIIKTWKSQIYSLTNYVETG